MLDDVHATIHDGPRGNDHGCTRAAAGAEAAAAAAGRGYGMGATHPAGRVRILIVDDEEPIAEVLAAVVEELGHDPLVAADGRQALALARDA